MTHLNARHALSSFFAQVRSVAQELWRLGRYDRPIGAGLLACPCLWGLAIAAPDFGGFLWPALLMIVGAFVMRGAGCMYNDMVDRPIDRLVTRTQHRPLAAGTLTLPMACVGIVVQLICGAWVLIQLPPPAWYLAPCSLVFVALYPWAKRFFVWPQLILGFAFNWGVIVGWGCFLPLASSSPWIFYAAGIVWTLAYDTLYAFQDLDDDQRIGVRSSAITFQHHRRRALVVLYLLMFVLFAWGLSLTLRDASLLCHWLSWGALGGVIIALGRGILHWNLHDNATCGKAFCDNMLVGVALTAVLLLRFLT